MRTTRVVPVFLALWLCSLPLGAEEQVTITVSDIPTERAMAARIDLRGNYEVIKAFERKYPHIKVQGFEGLRLDQNTAAGEGGLLMAIAGGTAPDIFVGSFRQARNYIDQGFFLPLDEYLDIEEQKRASHIPEQMWGIVEHQGAHYGLIDSYYLLMLIYRRDLFEEEGLDPDRAPKNWDELYEYAQILSRPNKKLAREEGFLQPVGQKGFALVKGILGGWMYTNFVWQAGGDMVRKVKDCPNCGHEHSLPKEEAFSDCPDCGNAYPEPASFRWLATFDRDPGVTALQFYKRMGQSIWRRCPSCDTPNDAPNDVCPKCGCQVYAEKEAASTPCMVCGTRVDTPAALDWRCRKCGQTLEFDDDVIDDGVCRVGDSAELVLGHTLARGEVAMLIGPGIEGNFVQIWRQAGLRSEQIGIATLPAGPTGKSVNLIGGTILGINATQHDEKIRQAAVEFIRCRRRPLSGSAWLHH